MNTILRTLLYEWNERALPASIQRENPIQVEQLNKTNNATVLTGFRRVGKTYLMYQTIQELLQTHPRDDVIYINFEDERIAIPQTNLLTDLIPEIQALYGKKPKYLFLDEIQLIPHWSKWVRRILDTESIHLVLTGSSSKMGSSELPTELRGRAFEKRVYPLSFSEFMQFKNEHLSRDKIAHMPSERARFLFLFNEYMQFGALPGVVLTEKERKQELLQQYFQTVVQKDLLERYRITNKLALKVLLKVLVNSSYITISKLHNSLKSLGIPIGKSTVDLYLSYIGSSFFASELFLYHQSIINRLQYARKIYCIDTGFISALSTQQSQNNGRLFEHIVFQELVKKNEAIYYFKDRQQREVDFVVCNKGKVTELYQACYDITDKETLEREVRSLLKAGILFDCSHMFLVVLNTNEVAHVPSSITILTIEDFLS